MGFYNIYTEGRQAEEYKACKTKEAEEKEKDENIRRENRTKLQRSAMIGTSITDFARYHNASREYLMMPKEELKI